jgi:ATP-dependent RNA helicase
MLFLLLATVSPIFFISTGFERPSAIQQRAILPILKKRDVIAQSQSGTGKTTIFCISVLQRINARSRETQALVLSPTRELAVQSRNVMMAFGEYMNINCHACIGGKNLGDDLKALQTGAQIVSGTPGRVLDLIQRRSLSTKKLQIIVID